MAQAGALAHGVDDPRPSEEDPHQHAEEEEHAEEEHLGDHQQHRQHEHDEEDDGDDDADHREDVIGIGVRLLELEKVRVGSFLPALLVAPVAVALFAR